MSIVMHSPGVGRGLAQAQWAVQAPPTASSISPTSVFEGKRERPLSSFLPPKHPTARHPTKYLPALSRGNLSNFSNPITSHSSVHSVPSTPCRLLSHSLSLCLFNSIHVLPLPRWMLLVIKRWERARGQKYGSVPLLLHHILGTQRPIGQ